MTRIPSSFAAKYLAVIASLALVPLPVLGGFCVKDEAPVRVALVIGNSGYEPLKALRSSANDATDVGTALARLGFAVSTIKDAGYTSLVRRLLDFEWEAARSEVAMVFYSGHAFGRNGRNFLVPVDAGASVHTSSPPSEAVPLDLAVNAVGRASGLGLVVMDADHHAQVDSPRNTLVAYAAMPGARSQDGTDGNSPYGKALLRYLMEEPGLEVGVMFRRIRDAVMESTGGDQQPIIYGSLPAEGVYLAGRLVAPGAAADEPTCRNFGTMPVR